MLCTMRGMSMRAMLCFHYHSGKTESFSPISMVLAEDFFFQIFSIKLRKFYSVFSLLKVFIISRFWILSNAFFASLNKIMWLLSFSLLMWLMNYINLLPTGKKLPISHLLPWMMLNSIHIEKEESFWDRIFER